MGMERENIFIDATNQVAGRLASRAAKEALNGKIVLVFNAEKAVISGNPPHVIKKYFEKVSRGDPFNGPFYPKMPDRMLKRIIRGMLPHRKAGGKEALKRIKVYNSVPEEFSKHKLISFGDEGSLPKFITLDKLSQRLGAKRVWA